jgi:hypothetical protein
VRRAKPGSAEPAYFRSLSQDAPGRWARFWAPDHGSEDSGFLRQAKATELTDHIPHGDIKKAADVCERIDLGRGHS